jgi:hypothetical protein
MRHILIVTVACLALLAGARAQAEDKKVEGCAPVPTPPDPAADVPTQVSQYLALEWMDSQGAKLCLQALEICVADPSNGGGALAKLLEVTTLPVAAEKPDGEKAAQKAKVMYGIAGSADICDTVATAYDSKSVVMAYDSKGEAKAYKGSMPKLCLGVDNPEICRAANDLIDALYEEHPEALNQVHNYYKKNRPHALFELLTITSNTEAIRSKALTKMQIYRAAYATDPDNFFALIHQHFVKAAPSPKKP